MFTISWRYKKIPQRPSIQCGADQCVTVSMWRQCGAVPSAQVVAALMRHGSWRFSVQLNNIINSQSQGPAPGPRRSKPQGLGPPVKLLFHAYLHKCNRCTEMFCFKGEILWFLFIIFAGNMFSIASDIPADIILKYFVTISPRHTSGGKSTPASDAALTCSCREK